ncbi:hypothetical protein F5I97DRAFT_1094462 [Phlebopus sp. FC_14]|nr:hypothetical protein F5I97DRAFT_1094462 [Phlebopus sp. FC_14]
MRPRENVTLCHPRHSSGKDTNQALLVRSRMPASLPPSYVVTMVDRFGFSANNIAYQALSEAPHFRYFDFHPAANDADISPKTHGVTPVWRFGTVVASNHPSIQAGERIYGYFAATRYIVLAISPADVNRFAFYVSRPHLPPDRRLYNQVIRCSADPLYDSSPEAEDLTMLYRPLFWTSFWCEDWLNSSQYRGGAGRILISSASAKTAFCLAYVIRKRSFGSDDTERQIVGLTSKKNTAFTQRLGLYDHVLTYEDFTVPRISSSTFQKWIYIDVAGNEQLNARVFKQFSLLEDVDLVASIALGLTNLSPSSGNALPADWSPTESFGTVTKAFETIFMPEWLAIRRNQLSVTQITRLQRDAWLEFMNDRRTWGINVHRAWGPAEVKNAYGEVVRLGIAPDQGFIWSMWEDGPHARL